MANSKESLDYWRKIFSSTKSDIFESIEKAILIAKVDFPKEFKERSTLIAEKLYNPHIPLFSDCNRAELHSLNNDNETPIIKKLLTIKELLCNYQDNPDLVLYKSLRSLQLMQLSVETLNETKIGITVNALRKHKSRLIRKLVLSLIKDWKLLFDQWFESKKSKSLSLAQEPSNKVEVLDTNLKLEITKKRLREGYEQAERAKKQRMIKVLELADIPVDLHNEKGRSKEKIGKQYYG